MKKIVFLAISAVFALASCQKEAVPAMDPVFKASIVDSKTSIDALSGTVSWVLNDEVSITDAAQTTVVYVASEVDGSSATLTKKEGETGTLGDGPYTAEYGTAPSSIQTYSASVPSLHMYAESNTENFNFTITCGLLELSVTQAAESLKSIAVSTATTTYTLACPSPESVATAKLFYIALPAGDYTSFRFVNADGQVCRFNLKAGKSFSILENKIHPLAFNSNLVFKDEALSGVFSVAADRQVRFSRGNLQYQASTGTWRFAANQYDYIGDNAGNNTASGRDTQSDWIDLFGWGATGRKDINNHLFYPYEINTTDVQYKTIDGESSGSETLTRANGGDWGICMGDGWRLLTGEEWAYLFSNSTHTNSLVEVTPGVFVYGVLVMPAGWSGKLVYSTAYSTWTTLESAGGVFIPSAGYRQGSTVLNSGANGYYWSSVVNSNRDGQGLYIKAGSAGSNAQNGIPRHYGASVRLVVDVPAAPAE